MFGYRTMGAVLGLGGLLWLPLAASAPRISEAQKMAIIRSLIAEVGIARQALPPNKHGVDLGASGQVLDPSKVAQALQEHGLAAKVGDRVAITAITFKGDRIVFDLNGGPHKDHWYNHVSIGMGGGAQPVGPSQVGPRGALITLHFAGGVPPLTPAAVKADLGALIDWDRPAEAEMMVRALPAPVKAAIHSHRVLVGMTPGMVVAALGRTNNKDRETSAQGQPYEDWMYGRPPAKTVFVRFIGGRVARVTTYLPNGTHIVDSTPDPALASQARQQQREAAQEEREAAEPPPTLRRPGDAPPPRPSGNGAMSLPPPGAGLPGQAPPTMPTAPGAPPTPSLPGMPPPGGSPPVCCGGN
ncbi:MAG TPA: hypothetical protein VMV31_13845 [Terriglobales bacterium]|nr:hypothetical protein [Terriglobales bacterium]